MFLTKDMNKQTENNKQTNCFLKILFENPNVFLKSNSRNTDWFVDSYPQVKSAEHVAKINSRSGTFPNFSWELYQKYIKRLWNIYRYINVLSIPYFTWKFFKMVADLVAVQKRTSAPREWHKVEVLEGKFRSIKLSFVPQKKTSFYILHV